MREIVWCSLPLLKVKFEDISLEMVASFLSSLDHPYVGPIVKFHKLKTRFSYTRLDRGSGPFKKRKSPNFVK